MIRKVAPGDRVRFHFSGSLADGRVFESSVEGEPVEAKLGEDPLAPGLERALIGMEPGTMIIENIPPKLGYGLAEQSDHPLAGQSITYEISLIDIL